MGPRQVIAESVKPGWEGWDHRCKAGVPRPDLEGGVIGRKILFGLRMSAKAIKGFNGKDLLRKDMAKLTCGLIGDLLESRQ